MMIPYEHDQKQPHKQNQPPPKALCSTGDISSAMVQYTKNSVHFFREQVKYRKIGQLHDDDIWLQLPEFISLLLCYLNLSIPLTIKEQ